MKAASLLFSAILDNQPETHKITYGLKNKNILTKEVIEEQSNNQEMFLVAAAPNTSSTPKSYIV